MALMDGTEMWWEWVQRRALDIKSGAEKCESEKVTKQAWLQDRAAQQAMRRKGGSAKEDVMSSKRACGQLIVVDACCCCCCCCEEGREEERWKRK